MAHVTQNIPYTKEHLVSDEEKQQREDYHNNTDATYHAGINVGREGFYDPEAGAAKHAGKAVESDPTPILATDPGQPKGITAKVTGREQNPVIDRSELGVVSSGRKRGRPAKAAQANVPESEETENTSR